MSSTPQPIEFYVGDSDKPVADNIVLNLYKKIVLTTVNTDLYLIIKTSKSFKKKMVELKEMYDATPKLRADSTIIEYPDMDKFFTMLEDGVLRINDITNHPITVDGNKVIFKTTTCFSEFDGWVKNIPTYLDFSSSDPTKLSYLRPSKIIEVFNKIEGLSLRGNNKLEETELSRLAGKFIVNFEPSEIYENANILVSTRTQVSGSGFMSKFFNEDGKSAGLLDDLIFQLKSKGMTKEYEKNFEIVTDLKDVKAAYLGANYVKYPSDRDSYCDCDDDDDCDCSNSYYTPGNLGDSCMRYERNQGVLEIYGNPNSGVAVLKTDTGAIRARCVVWTNAKSVDENFNTILHPKLYDRMYSEDNETSNILTALLKANGYEAIRSLNGLIMFESKGNYHTRYPYIDTFSYKTRDNFFARINSSVSLGARDVQNHNGYEFSYNSGITPVSKSVYSAYVEDGIIAVCEYTGQLMHKTNACKLFTGNIVNNLYTMQIRLHEQSFINSTPNLHSIINADGTTIVNCLISNCIKSVDDKYYHKKDLKIAYVNGSRYYVPIWWIEDEDAETVLQLDSGISITIHGKDYSAGTTSKASVDYSSIRYYEYC